MSVASEVLSVIEAAGAKLQVGKGGKIQIEYLEESHEIVAPLLGQLQANREEAIQLLSEREKIPRVPDGVRLVAWKLKAPPVAIEECSVVVDTQLFARTTLAQLGQALAYPKRWVGWTTQQLVDRLGGVGVIVELESLTASRTSAPDRRISK